MALPAFAQTFRDGEWVELPPTQYTDGETASLTAKGSLPPYRTYTGVAFWPLRSDMNHATQSSAVYATANAATNSFQLTLDYEPGTVISQVVFYAVDSDNGGAAPTFSLISSDPNTTTSPLIHGEVGLTGSNANVRSVTLTLAPAVVVQADRSYRLRFGPAVNSVAHALHGAKVYALPPTVFANGFEAGKSLLQKLGIVLPDDAEKSIRP